MARTFALVSQASLIEDYNRNNRLSHTLSGRHYEMTRRGGRVFQRRYELDASGAEVNSFELEATYAIGSGNHARTYLSRSESGELIELPVTWYTQENRWGMSPGYDNAAPPDFTRLADESCLFCHNGYPAAGGVRSPYSEVSTRWKSLECELTKIVRQTRRDESRRGRHECLRHESEIELQG